MIKTEKKEKTSVLFINVPLELRKKFKAYCATLNKSMTDKLIEYMRSVTK